MTETMSRASRAIDNAAVSALNQLEALFWVKDVERRFVLGTDAFLRMLGRHHASEIIGLRDEDTSPEYLVQHYRSYDLRVLNQGETITDLVEIVRRSDATYGWAVTSKWPVYSVEADCPAEIVGVAGLTRLQGGKTVAPDEVQPFAAALEMITSDYGKSIKVSDLASASAMSTAHFSRRFRDHFGVTPHRYLRRVRMMAVCDLLSTTDMPLGRIAAETGYYDQSHLANEFVAERGMTPSAYRRAHRDGRAPALGLDDRILQGLR